MKANSKRKVFGDAVDLLMGDMEEVTMPRGVQMLPVKSIQPFHDHPFHLYEGERLDDMIASVKEHGVLNPVIVQKLDAGYEMLSGHNRWNAAKLAGIKEIPAIVKTDLSEEEAYVYVIETNLMLRLSIPLNLTRITGYCSTKLRTLSTGQKHYADIPAPLQTRWWPYKKKESSQISSWPTSHLLEKRPSSA